jgi:hypothetical protein
MNFDENSRFRHLAEGAMRPFHFSTDAELSGALIR